MKKLWLIKSGHSYVDSTQEEDLESPWQEVYHKGLTDKGIAQALSLGVCSRGECPDLFLSSRTSSARQTLDCVLEGMFCIFPGCSVLEDVHFGLDCREFFPTHPHYLSNLSSYHQVLKRYHAGDFHPKITMNSGGENLFDLWERVSSFLKFVKEEPFQHMLCATHDYFIKMLLFHFIHKLGEEDHILHFRSRSFFSFVETFNLPHGAVVELSLGGDGKLLYSGGCLRDHLRLERCFSCDSYQYPARLVPLRGVVESKYLCTFCLPPVKGY